MSVTNDDEYYIEGGITISFYVERLDANGTAYFTANGDLYVQLFAGDILKFDIGGEKAEKLENWLNENCEYTDEKKNAEVAGDVDPSEKAVTSVAKDDSDILTKLILDISTILRTLGTIPLQQRTAGSRRNTPMR